MLFASITSAEAQLWIPLGSVLLVGGALVAIVAVCQWRKVRQAEIDATLKQQMLDRGMSADEIVRVLSATPRRDES